MASPTQVPPHHQRRHSAEEFETTSTIMPDPVEASTDWQQQQDYPDRYAYLNHEQGTYPYNSGIYNLDNVPTSVALSPNKESWLRSNFRFNRLTGAIAVAAAATFGIPATIYTVDNVREYTASLDGNHKDNIDSNSPNSNPERPAGLTLDNATPDQFYDNSYFTDTERIQWADEQLNALSADPENPNMTTKQAAYERLREQLKRDSDVPLDSLVEPSISNSPNDANNQMLAVEAAAGFELDFGKAQKLLAAAYDKDSEYFSRLVSTFKEFRDKYGNHLTQNDLYKQTFAYEYTPFDPNVAQQTGGNLVPEATGLFTHEPIGGITPENGTPTRIVYMTVSQTADNIPDSEMVQTFTADHWIAVEKIARNDPAKWVAPNKLVTLHEQ